MLKEKDVSIRNPYLTKTILYKWKILDIPEGLQQGLYCEYTFSSKRNAKVNSSTKMKGYYKIKLNIPKVINWILFR